MPELKKVDVTTISIVPKGANGEPIQIYKAAGSKLAENEIKEEVKEEVKKTEETTEETGTIDTVVETPVETTKGFLKKLFEPLFKSLDLGPLEVQKASDIDTGIQYESFTSRMNNPEARFDYAVDQLRYAVCHIFWNDNLTNGKELILQNIDDFKRYIEGIFDNTVEVQKQFFEKGAEEDMQKDEFSEVVKAALEPVTQALTDLTEKVSKMEQANVTPADPAVETPATAAAAEGTEDVTKSAEETKEPDIAEIVKSVINEAISPISKSIGELTTRVEKMESVKGVSKGLELDSKVEKAADPWADLHIPGLG